MGANDCSAFEVILLISMSKDFHEERNERRISIFLEEKKKLIKNHTS